MTTLKFRAQVRSNHGPWVDGGLFVRAQDAQRDSDALGVKYGNEVRVVHEGPVQARHTEYGRVLVLCPHGHMVQSVKSEDWGGSLWEDRCGRGHHVQCDGAIA